MFPRTTWSPAASDWRPGILDHFSPYHEDSLPWPVDEDHFLRDPDLGWRVLTTVDQLNRHPATDERTLLIVALEAATDPRTDALWGMGVRGRILFVPREDLEWSLARLSRLLGPDGSVHGKALRHDLLWRIARHAKQ